MTNWGTWKFDEKVAKNFEDMMLYSIPCYSIVQKMFLDLAEIFLKRRGSRVLDLGASPGITMQNIIHKFPYVKYHAVDSSDAMIYKLREKVRLLENFRIKVVKKDLNNTFYLKENDYSLIIMSCVLMFVEPENRLQLLNNCYKGLKKGGGLILFNKIKGEDMFEQRWIDFYHSFKRQHYSWKEIRDKDRALEGILIPNTLEGDLDLLDDAGFSKVDIFFKWYNFCGYAAVK